MSEPVHGDRFPTTHWTMVRRAGGDAAALSDLLRAYLPALRRYLVSAKRLNPDRADDVLQEFVSVKFIQQNLAERARQDRGRFRTLVLTALDRFYISYCRAEQAEKRAANRAVSIDGELEHFEPPAQGSQDVFALAWARQVIERVVARMVEECRANDREDLWGVFQGRLLGPLLEGHPQLEYAELVERYGFKSPTQAANALVTVKRMFQRHLWAVIGEYAPEGEIETELDDLYRALADR